MSRFANMGLGALAGAAALALLVGGVARAQQQAQGAPLRTEAEVEASPAVKRLKELVDVVNSADAATVTAYVLANGADVMRPQPPAELPLIGLVLDLQRRSQGLEFLRVTTVENDRVVAVVRNKLTGDEQSLSVRVEPQAPHRITGIPNSPPPVTARAVQSEQAELREIGSYLERLSGADVFSGAVIIARGGTPVFSHAYGYADRQKKVPNTLSTPFLMASTNKLFTGLAIGRLVDQGKLSYDDPLAKFLPDFPDSESAKRIKIKHLLSHTSGLQHGYTRAYYNSLDNMRTVRAILDTFERKPIKFEPGTSWAYSNLGFTLLGRIIEIVSGEDYYDYMGKNVFAPAGIESASFPVLPQNGLAVVPMAYPYEVEFNGERLGYVNKLGAHFRRGGPACCSVVSALDLMKLANALPMGRVVKPETFRLHSSPKPELGATMYGYGFETTRYKRALTGHSGNAFGQCTEFGELRDTPYTLIVLSNVGMNDCTAVTEKILQVLRPTKTPAS